MGWNDHIDDTPLEYEVKQCPHCGEYYRCSKTEQVPGFRETEEDVCPYCNTINGSSMTYEYYCSKLTESEKEYLRRKGIL